jgi:hypothetical protein
VIDSLAAALTVVALLAAVVTVVVVIVGRYRARPTVLFLGGFEFVLLVQGAVAVAGLLGGHEAREPGTFLAYLAVSVLVLPATILQVRGDDDRWAGVLVAVALAVVAVVVVRAETTWRS